MKYLVFLMTVAVALVGWVTPVVADEAPQREGSDTTVATQDTTLPAGASGMMVFVDPETGKVTGSPTAEQRAAMQTRMVGLFDQSDDGTFDEILPNGAVLRDLQGRLMNATVVRISPDGTRHEECTERPMAVLAAEMQPNTAVAPTHGAATK